MALYSIYLEKKEKRVLKIASPATQCQNNNLVYQKGLHDPKAPHWY